MPSETSENPRLSHQSFLLFQAAQSLCALPVDDIGEILPMASLHCASTSSGILAGFLNLGGAAIPVLHLWRLLDTDPAPLDLRTSIIVVETGPDRLGLIASEIHQVITAAADEIVKLPDHAVTRTAVRHQQSIVPIISIDELVMEQERQRLAELRQVQQQRLSQLQETHI